MKMVLALIVFYIAVGMKADQIDRWTILLSVGVTSAVVLYTMFTF